MSDNWESTICVLIFHTKITQNMLRSHRSGWIKYRFLGGWQNESLYLKEYCVVVGTNWWKNYGICYSMIK